MAKGRRAAERKRIETVMDRLRDAYADVTTELLYEDPFQLLIATILSAQTTDARVNETTPGLFRRFPTPAALASADPPEVEQILKPLGFFRQKTRSIIGTARMLEEEHGGVVPQRMEDLVALPGVGRKTAAVVLGTAFDIQEGIFVDTHVKRVSYRLAFTDHTDPLKIEQDLMGVLPQKDWTLLGHALVLHGRYVCTARKPACPACVLLEHCPQRGVTAVRDSL